MNNTRLESLRAVEKAYREMVVRSLTSSPESFLAIKGNGPKKLRKAQRADLEVWRYARGSRTAYEKGGMQEMFKFQHNFKWRYNK